MPPLKTSSLSVLFLQDQEKVPALFFRFWGPISHFLNNPSRRTFTLPSLESQSHPTPLPNRPQQETHTHTTMGQVQSRQDEHHFKLDGTDKNALLKKYTGECCFGLGGTRTFFLLFLSLSSFGAKNHVFCLVFFVLWVRHQL